MKFYIVDKNAIKPKEHHIIIPINYDIVESNYYSWLINLTDDEFENLDHYSYEYVEFANNKNWIPVELEVPLWNFLKTKHTFEIIEIGHWDDYGINSFELSDDDIMYIKLLQ